MHGENGRKSSLGQVRYQETRGNDGRTLAHPDAARRGHDCVGSLRSIGSYGCFRVHLQLTPAPGRLFRRYKLAVVGVPSDTIGYSRKLLLAVVGAPLDIIGYTRKKARRGNTEEAFPGHGVELGGWAIVLRFVVWKYPLKESMSPLQRCQKRMAFSCSSFFSSNAVGYKRNARRSVCSRNSRNSDDIQCPRLFSFFAYNRHEIYDECADVYVSVAVPCTVLGSPATVDNHDQRSVFVPGTQLLLYQFCLCVLFACLPLICLHCAFSSL